MNQSVANVLNWSFESLTFITSYKSLTFITSYTVELWDELNAMLSGIHFKIISQVVVFIKHTQLLSYSRFSSLCSRLVVWVKNVNHIFQLTLWKHQ